MITEELQLREELTTSRTDRELLILLRPEYPKCNVNCSYCGFHRKKREGIVVKERILRGRLQFSRIIKKIERLPIQKTLFFVPDAELFISAFYRDVFVRLLGNPYISRCCFQTNLCFDVESFLNRIDTRKLMLWVTFHPGQYDEEQEEQFFANVTLLRRRDVKFSVGVIATKNRIKHLREYKKTFDEKGIHMWINGMKGVKQPFYSQEEKDIICSLDSLACYETEIIESKGLECSAGRDSVFIDSRGYIHRCMLDLGPRMGNILKDDIHLYRTSMPCPNEYCGCYIAYMNLKKPEFDSIFGETMPCRLPKLAQ